MHKYLLQYKRVSSKVQLKGTGLTQQQLSDEALSQLQDKYGLQLYPTVFTDEAVSAFKVSASERPSFSKLLHLIESEHVSDESVLVLYNLDRLSRQNISSALSTLLRVLDSCRIYIAQEGRLFDKNDPDLMVNLMMALISLSRANEESEVKRKRKNQSVDAIIERHLNGERGKNGGVLWYFTGGYPLWFKLEDRELLLNDPMVKAIRKFIDMIIKGSSANAAWVYLKENYPAPRLHKNGWAKGMLMSLHKNKALIGEWSYSGRDIPNYITPIIDEKTYYQFVNARTKRNYQKTQSTVSIFTGYGISHCSCGAHMNSQIANGYRTIRCSTVALGEPCSSPASTSEKGLLAAMNQNLMKCIGMVDNDPIDSKLPLLEAELEKSRAGLLKIEQDYLETQASVLIPLMQTQQNKVDDLIKQIEEEKLNTNVYVPEYPSQIPTDPSKLRELYRNTLTRLKFMKLPDKQGVRVFIDTVYGIKFSLTLKGGRCIGIGDFEVIR